MQLLRQDDRVTTGDARDVTSRLAQQPDRVLRYAGHADGVVDVRLPPDRSAGALAAAAVVVLLHGGFWRAEWDRVHIRPLADGLAERGAVVLTPEYRRTGAPGGGWPGTFDDVAAALDAVPRLASEVGATAASGVTFVGHSAGGHLALWGAGRSRLPTASRWYAPLDYPVAGVVGLAAVGDLVWTADADLDDGAAVALVGGSTAQVPHRYALADPMRLLPLGVRLALLHGTVDRNVPVEMTRAFASAAEAAGDAVRLRILDGVEHFALIDPLSSAWREVVSAFEWVRS